MRSQRARLAGVARANLGRALAAQGRVEEALPHLRKALELDPTSAAAHAALGDALYALSRMPAALSEWREAIRLAPDYLPAMQHAAWALATSPENGARNGNEALALALRAVQATGGRDAAVLDTLAVAYAAVGRFDAAVTTARRALLVAAPAQAGAIRRRAVRIAPAVSGWRQLSWQVAPIRTGMSYRTALLFALAAAMQADARPREFRELLNLSGGLRFTSSSESRAVVFRCEPNGTPAEGSALHLFLQHSPGLDGNRSFLSITLNYGLLRSVRLDEENERPVELVVPLPAALLKPVNELSLSLEQFAPRGIPVWTAVKPRSYLALQYDWNAPEPDLAALPLPLVDPARVIDVLVPQRPSSPTLEAAALLLASFASRLAPDVISVRTVDSTAEAVHPLLVVGTVAEQPEFRRLLPPAAPEEGLAGFAGRTLFVTGGSPLGVLRAAKSLLRRGVPGKLARFSSDPPSEPRSPRDWKGFIPPRSRFSLADLGLQGQTFSASSGFSTTIALNATPDAVFLDYGPEMVLSLAFDAAAFDVNPELTVELNGTELRRTELREVSRRPQFTLALAIPPRLLRAENTLRVTVRGSLAGTHGAGSLLPDTQFYLPRDYRATLPDTALLQRRLYPFSLRPDFSDTLILAGGSFAALADLAVELGRAMPAESPAFRVRRARDAGEMDLARNHLIFLGTAPSSLRLPNAPVVELISPWNAEKCMLRISPRARGLWGAVAAGPQRTYEEAPFLMHVQARLSANWMALPAVLSLVSGLLFVGLRVALAHYKRHGAA